MSLKGSLKDFNITNILQMISVEKKTGSLCLSFNKEVGSVYFSEGKVVFADQGGKKDDERLKNVLVGNNYIKENDWSLVCIERLKSLRPIYSVLKRYVLKDVLSKLINKQIKDAVFRLITWEKGLYEFTQQNVTFDNDLVTPMDIEFLLMEGCRVKDESELINERLRKVKKYIRKNIFDKNISYDDLTDKDAKNLEIELLEKRGLGLSLDEKTILRGMNEYSTLEEILNFSMLLDFETLTIIDKFLEKKIIVPQRVSRQKRSGSLYAPKGFYSKHLEKLLGVTLILLLLFVNILIGISRLDDIKGIFAMSFDTIGDFREFLNESKYPLIEDALYDFVIINGKYPENLMELYDTGQLKKRFAGKQMLENYDYIYSKEENTFILSYKKIRNNL